MKFTFSHEERTLLQAVAQFAESRGVELFLVGGAVRDGLLKRRTSAVDFDFCLKKGGLDFARSLARSLRAGYVVLDREHASCRVVKKLSVSPGHIGLAHPAVSDRQVRPDGTGAPPSAVPCTLDFTDFRGPTLRDDVHHRDFTINTLAIELSQALHPIVKRTAVRDYCSGARDILSGVIRATGPHVFDEDPLRIARAFSLAAQLQFRIDAKTLALIKKKRPLLQNSSPERVREELLKVCGSARAGETLTHMYESQVLERILPEISVMRGVAQGPYHHLDVLEHSFETVRQLQKLFDSFDSDRQMSAYLNEEIASAHSRRALLTLAALLHDIGKPKAKRVEDGKMKFYGHERVGADMSVSIARRLRFSNDEIASLRTLIFWHLRPGYLGDQVVISPRAEFRYFRDTAREGGSVLLLSLADQRATRGKLTTRQARMLHEKNCALLLKRFFHKAQEPKLVRLVNGDDLQRAFHLTPSPLIGELLTALDELQALQKIRTPAEALTAAETMLKKKQRAKAAR